MANVLNNELHTLSNRYLLILSLLIPSLLILQGCQSNLGHLGTPIPISMPAMLLPDDKLVTRIALGSCFQPEQDDAIFRTIKAADPDVFLFIGDNVYAADESDDPALKSLQAAYANLAQSTEFAQLREAVPLIVTWDDHDYGADDAGGDWPHKFQSEKIFEQFWAIPANDVRATRDGVYYARIVGPPGQRTQFIVLDTRFFKTPATFSPEDQNLLGDDQWLWLEEQLNQTADVRIIVSSIQLLGTGYSESWSKLPLEQERLFDLIAKTDANGIIVVSGDLHSGAMYSAQRSAHYPITEFTASSLNQPVSGFVTNIKDKLLPERIDAPFHDANFGLIEIDWSTKRLVLLLKDEHGDTVRQKSIAFEELTGRT